MARAYACQLTPIVDDSTVAGSLSGRQLPVRASPPSGGAAAPEKFGENRAEIFSLGTTRRRRLRVTTRHSQCCAVLCSAVLRCAVLCSAVAHRRATGIATYLLRCNEVGVAFEK